MTRDEKPYRIRNIASGLLLEVYQTHAESGVLVRQGRELATEGARGQLWWVTPVFHGSALHHLESVASGERLDVTQVPPVPGVPLWRVSSAGPPEWLVEEHVGRPGTYSLVSYHSGLLLEVADGSLRDGAHVRQGEDVDSPCQWWALERADA